MVDIASSVEECPLFNSAEGELGNMHAQLSHVTCQAPLCFAMVTDHEQETTIRYSLN